MKSLTLHQLKPYTPRLVAYTGLVVMSVAFTMATALSVADFLKVLFPPDATASASHSMATASFLSQLLEVFYGWIMGFGRKRALIYFALIVFGLYAFKNIFGYLAAVQMSVVRCKVVRNLRNQLFDKYMLLPLSYYSSTRKGDMLTRFGGDIVEYEEGTLSSVQQLVLAVISMALYLAMLFVISVKITLFVLCMLPIIAFAISGITHRLRRNSQELQERYSFLTSLMEETIMGLKIIKSYTALNFSNSRFRRYDKSYAQLRTRIFRRVDLSSPVSDFLGNCVVVCILLFGSMQVMAGDGGLSAELFVSYIMMFVLMIPPSKELTTAISQIKKGRACADRIKTLLEQPDAIHELPDTIPFDGLHRQVEFCSVGFSYTSGVEVLKDINITIPRGSTVALVGSSGAGKSTLVNLLMRFYDCTQGEIRLDGILLQKYRVADVRQHLGMVLQETQLFNDTVHANIAFGYPQASRQEVIEAAKSAHAHDFVMALPKGYDTPIGEGGGCLSGGQRQRISIARAILRNPDILILDEATSALDSESEQQVQHALENVLQNRTAFIIAHRLSTIQHADTIIVMEKGRIIEQGTHTELLQHQSRYWQLVQMQSFT